MKEEEKISSPSQVENNGIDNSESIVNENPSDSLSDDDNWTDAASFNKSQSEMIKNNCVESKVNSSNGNGSNLPPLDFSNIKHSPYITPTSTPKKSIQSSSSSVNPNHVKNDYENEDKKTQNSIAPKLSIGQSIVVSDVPFPGVNPNKKIKVEAEAWDRHLKGLAKLAIEEDRWAEEEIENLWKGEKDIRIKRIAKQKKSKAFQGMYLRFTL